jgi:hypothetical protein
MAADVSGLRDRVFDRGRALQEGATESVLAELELRVPDSGQQGSADKLRNTQQVQRLEDPAGILRTVITYPTPNATFQEEGTAEHPIDPHLPPSVLRFFSSKAGGIIFARHVDHPGSHKNDGWFRKVTERWPEFLQDAQQRLP